MNEQPKSVSEKYLTDMLTTLGGADNLLHLYSNDLTPGPNTELADLVEADFTGYAPVTLDGGWTVGQDEQGRYTMRYDELPAFTQTNTTVTNVVYGWYITNIGETTLLAVSRLPVPVSFDAIGTELVLKLLMAALFTSLEHAEIFG